MKLPLQIAFHNLPHSAEIEEAVHTEAARLEDFSDRIMSCRVVVDVPHHHHEHGNLYEVRLDLKVPNGEIAVKRNPAEHFEYRDVGLAIRDAFDDALRQLQDRVRIEQGQVKSHETLAHARVSQINPLAGYGFLETPDGREIYFHKNSVMNGDFRVLDIGSEVRFVEELGDKGPQASTVHLVGRHNGS